MKVRNTRLPLSLCPSCGAKLSGAGSAHGWTPSPGDGTFCAYCRALLVYGPDLRPRLPTDAERAEFMAAPEVKQQYLDLCRAAEKGAFPIGKSDTGKPQ